MSTLAYVVLAAAAVAVGCFGLKKIVQSHLVQRKRALRRIDLIIKNFFDSECGAEDAYELLKEITTLMRQHNIFSSQTAAGSDHALVKRAYRAFRRYVAQYQRQYYSTPWTFEVQDSDLFIVTAGLDTDMGPEGQSSYMAATRRLKSLRKSRDTFLCTAWALMPRYFYCSKPFFCISYASYEETY